MYRAIARKPSLRQVYADALVKRACSPGARSTRSSPATAPGSSRRTTPRRRSRCRPGPRPWGASGRASAAAPSGAPRRRPPRVDRRRCARSGEAITTAPTGFRVHPKLAKVLEGRAQMVKGVRPLDWGTGEALAIGALAWRGRACGSSVRTRAAARSATVTRCSTIASRGRRIRRSRTSLRTGSGRGPRQPALGGRRAGLRVRLQPRDPDALTIWEAQFGDFVNAAQVIMDQFLSSGEDKWNRLSGLVLLLPHGMEGQGPEHSSARLERFLELSAEDNRQRREPHHAGAVLPRAAAAGRLALAQAARRDVAEEPAPPPAGGVAHRELAEGRFRAVIPDDAADPTETTRVVLCSGKLYYDLAAAREAAGAVHAAIVRLEQLYPLDVEGVRAAVERFRPEVEIVWAQEEPSNMGAWDHVEREPRASSRRPGGARRARAVGEPCGGLRDASQARAGAARPRGARRARLAAPRRRARSRRRGDYMAIELKVPSLGESVTQATIGAWLKNEGDAVQADEPVVEVESEKATVALPAPAAGVLRRVLKRTGDTVSVGETIARARGGAAAESGAASPLGSGPMPGGVVPGDGAPARTAEPATAAPVGEARRERAPVAERGRDRCRSSGVAATRRRGSEGPRAARPRARAAWSRSTASRPAASRGPAPAGRCARRTWCGCSRRRPSPPAARGPAPVPEPVRAPADGAEPRERIVPMTSLRRTVARRLVEAQHTAAILTTFNEVDMTRCSPCARSTRTRSSRSTA